MNFLSVIGQFFEFIISLFPHIYVGQPGHVAIKHKTGRYNILLDHQNGIWFPCVPVFHPLSGRTGIHVYWPIFTHITEFDCRWFWINTGETTVTTDGKTVVYQATVRWRVQHPLELVLKQATPENEVANSTRAALFQAVTQSNEDQNPLDLCKVATKIGRESVEVFGLQIQTIQLTDRAQTDRVHKLFGANSDFQLVDE